MENNIDETIGLKEGKEWTEEETKRLQEFIQEHNKKRGWRRRIRNRYLGYKYMISDKMSERGFIYYLAILVAVGTAAAVIWFLINLSWIVPFLIAIAFITFLLLKDEKKDSLTKEEKSLKAFSEVIDSMSQKDHEDLLDEFFPNVIKVKIVKCSNQFAWYNSMATSKEKETFLVERTDDPNLLRTVNDINGSGIKGFIHVGDVEFLKD